ncbi:unnamed protein product [Auanema sp. JU1783]|nr:unnamed protein product [Auanema sp. JU1783]
MELLQRVDVLLEEATFSDEESNEGPCFDFEEELTRISRNIDEQSSDFYSLKEIVGVKRTEPSTNISVRLLPNKNEPTLKRITKLHENTLSTDSPSTPEVIIHLNSDTEDESDGEILFLKCVRSELLSERDNFKDVKREFKSDEFKSEVQQSINAFTGIMERRDFMTEQKDNLKAYKEFVEDIERKVRESHSSKEKPSKMFVREFKKAISTFSYPLKPGFKCHDDNFFRIDNLVWQLPCQNETVSRKAYSRFIKAKFNQKKIMESFTIPAVPSSPNEKEQVPNSIKESGATVFPSPPHSYTSIPIIEEPRSPLPEEQPVIPEEPQSSEPESPRSPPASSYFNYKVIPLAGPASSIQLVNNSLFTSSMKVIETEKTTLNIDEPRNVPLVDTSVLLQKTLSPLRGEKKDSLRDILISSNTPFLSPLRSTSEREGQCTSCPTVDAPSSTYQRIDLTPEVVSCVSDIVHDVENNTSVILSELVEITCDTNSQAQPVRNNSLESDLSYHTVAEEQVELEVLTLGDSPDVPDNIPSIIPITYEGATPLKGSISSSESQCSITTEPPKKLKLSSISKRKRKADQDLYVLEDQSFIASKEKEPKLATSSHNHSSYPIVTIGDDDDDNFIRISFLDKSRHRLALHFTNPFIDYTDQDNNNVPIITLEDASKPPNTTFLLHHLEEEFPVEEGEIPDWRLVPIDTFPGEGLRIFEKYKLPNHIELPLRNTEEYALLESDRQPVPIPLISLAPKQSQAVCPLVTIDDDDDDDDIIIEKPPHPGMLSFLQTLGVSELSRKKREYRKVHDMLTAEHQRTVSNYSYYLRDELMLMEKGLVPIFGTTVVKRYKYPFDHCKGLYWPIFQPTDAVSINDLHKIMVADVYNQITNQTCYSYAQKKDLLCDSSPNIWNTQFREVMDKSDSYITERGRFKNRVSYARAFSTTSELEAKSQDLLSQLEEAFWIRGKLGEKNIQAVSDQEESRIVEAEIECRSNMMYDHIRFNIVDKYSSSTIDPDVGERKKSLFPDSWQQYPRDVYLCTNSRRNLIPDAVNHLNSIAYKEIDNTIISPPSEEHVLETQKAILHAAYLFQRGRIGNQSSPLLTEEENRISKERIGKIKALSFTISYNGKSSFLNELWEMVALQDWETKYWPIIWDNLAATYKKLPPVSLLTEKCLDELHQSFTRYVNINDRREYCKMYYSKLDLRKPLADAQ